MVCLNPPFIDYCDVGGNVHKALKNALYVPSYKQDIFSVYAAVSKGATVNFSPDNAKLVTPDGTEFKIKQAGNLYYLNSAMSSNMSKQDSETKSLKDWHEILDHCNLNDVLALEGVDGMKIVGKKEFDCGMCVEGRDGSRIFSDGFSTAGRTRILGESGDMLPWKILKF